MLRPVIAIVGRPNVGKSTLFNRLVGRRQSLVRDVPGVTRDRLYGTVTFERWQGTVVDTGGFEPGSTDDLVAAMRAQIMQAIEEADLVVLTVDTREGLTPVDVEIARILRRSGRPVVVAANKVDGAGQEAMLGEVHRLGFPRVLPVSAEHGRGVAELLEAIRAAAPAAGGRAGRRGHARGHRGPAERRQVAPSSTRCSGSPACSSTPRPAPRATAWTRRCPSAAVPTSSIDTAGIRRKGKVSEALEKLSVVMALKSLERCQVAVLARRRLRGDHRAGRPHRRATPTTRDARSSSR